MMMVWRKRGIANRIGRRLVVAIIAFSSVLVVIESAIKLVNDYHQQRAELEHMLDDIGILLPPVAASVWAFDDRQIALALDGLTHLPHIDRATVTTSDGKSSWSAGAARAQHHLDRSYPLDYAVRGQSQSIGRIEVWASLDGLRDRLLSQAIIILVGNVVVALLVGLFMYVLFSRIVTHRIAKLAENVGAMGPRLQLTEGSSSDDFMNFPERGDEIDALGWGFKDLERRLKVAVEDLHDRNAELKDENAERRRVEADLQRLVEQLYQANSELERFAYVAAHDLKEPVRGLVSFSQLLEQKYGDKLDGEGREYTRFIITEARRMGAMISDLLDYSRTGHNNQSVKDIDCAEVVDGVIQTVSQMIDQKKALVGVGPLPKLRADPLQLHQVFLNLIVNALKYSRAGVTPEIRIDAERQEGGWRFEIADNGIGIDPQYHSYVFEVFRRLHTRDSIPGTGIGLALCKRIVEGHGGAIWLSSVPGHGSSFFFTVPDGLDTTA